MEIEEEPSFDVDSLSSEFHAQDTETDTTETEDDQEDKYIKPSLALDNNLRKQPKFIVFLAKLLLLFNVCPACKSENPSVTSKEVGTMVEIKTVCKSSSCPMPENIWRSQPEMAGTRISAGNFLLCFSILVSGGSASKVLQIFNNMGLSCLSLRTYFTHQREKLFPTIFLYWKSYQSKMLENLKETGEALVIAGDGRHDSMGQYFAALSLLSFTFHLFKEMLQEIVQLWNTLVSRTV